MAKETKPKSAQVEKAAAFVFGKMDKDVKKRQWTPAAYGALIRQIAIEHGAKFPTPDAAKAFAQEMKDSDLSFSSNWKKYAVDRGWLPASDEYADVDFDK
jgi:hypothetical protein